MERQSIKADSREAFSKGGLHSLRLQGKIPAILYGQNLKPVPLSVDSKGLIEVVRKGGMNALIDLQLEGNKEKSPLVVMIKEMQTDVLSRRILHLDLLKVDMKEKVTVQVPIRLTGKPVGVEKGGLVEQSRRELEVKCLPGNIPEAIEVDIAALDVGNSIHVNDLKFPEGVELPHEANFVIVAVVIPKEEKPAEEAAPAEAVAAAPAAGAEGAAAPAEGAEKKPEKKEEKKQEK